MERVFVYGTLKRGFYNAQVLAKGPGKAKFVGKAKTVGFFHLSVGGEFFIPYLQKVGNVGNQIYGEVYEVCDVMLDRLDELEGVPHHYSRKLEYIMLLDDSNQLEQLECFVYIKSAQDFCLLKNNPLENYTLDLHANYIPPPLRLSSVQSELESIRERFDEMTLKGSEISWIYAPDCTFFKEKISQKFHELGQTSHFLEVGCGGLAPASSFLLRSAIKCKITALDCSEKQLKQALLTTQIDSLRSQHVTFQHANVVNIGALFRLGEFEGIACTQVLHLLPETLIFHVLRTLSALLNDKGSAFLVADWPLYLDEFLRDHIPLSGLKSDSCAVNPLNGYRCSVLRKAPFE